MSHLARIVLSTLAAALLLAAAPAIAGAVTLTECTEEELVSAIADAPAGATIEFGCDGHIVWTANRELSKDVTIDGAGHDVVLDGDGQFQLFGINGGVAVTLRGLTLANGHSQGLFGGGAIFNLGQLVVEDVDFLDNHAYEYGGAIYSRGPATLEVIDSLFAGNLVTCPDEGQGGGAIAVQMASTLKVTGSTFSANVATGGAAGGAILGMHSNHPGASGPIEIHESWFDDNVSHSDRPSYFPGMHTGGGAIAVYNHRLTITETEFARNAASAWGGPVLGGAVLVSPSTAPLDAKPAHISDALFLDNVAHGDHDGDPDRLGSWGIGGAVATIDQPVTLERSQLLGNTASRGGALAQLSGAVTLADSVLQGNHVQEGTPAPVGAGGIETYGTTTVSGSIVLDNGNVNCLALSDAERTGAIVDGGHNVEEPGSSCGFNRAPAPAPFVPSPEPPAPGDLPAPPAASAPPAAPVAPPASGPAPPSARELAARALGRRVVPTRLRLGDCRAFVPAGAGDRIPVRRDLLRLALTCSEDARVAVRAWAEVGDGGERRRLELTTSDHEIAGGAVREIELRLDRGERRLLRAGRRPELHVALTVDGRTRDARWRIG